MRSQLYSPLKEARTVEIFLLFLFHQFMNSCYSHTLHKVIYLETVSLRLFETRDIFQRSLAPTFRIPNYFLFWLQARYLIRSFCIAYDTTESFDGRSSNRNIYFLISFRCVFSDDWWSTTENDLWIWSGSLSNFLSFHLIMLLCGLLSIFVHDKNYCATRRSFNL